MSIKIILNQKLQYNTAIIILYPLLVAIKSDKNYQFNMNNEQKIVQLGKIQDRICQIQFFDNILNANKFVLIPRSNPEYECLQNEGIAKRK